MYRVPIYRVQLVRDGSCKMAGRHCASPPEVAALFRELVGDADREHLVAMFLDVHNRFLGVQTVSIGDIENTIAHPREVFKAAILLNAASVILAHDHPSGRCSPSDVDIRMTREMVAVGYLEILTKPAPAGPASGRIAAHPRRGWHRFCTSGREIAFSSLQRAQ